MVFTAEVSSFSRDGLAAVENGRLLINVGPVDCEPGEQIRVKFLGQKEEMGNDVGFGICLTETYADEEYMEFVRGYRSHLIPDEPLLNGEEGIAEVSEIGERNLGIASLGNQRTRLGPISGEEGDLVQLEGTGGNFARVVTDHRKGENYENRFKILSSNYAGLPISVGDTVTLTISDVDDGSLVGYKYDIPIRFPNGDAEISQKVDCEISGVDIDSFAGEIIRTYDEPSKVPNASQWARMQWVRKAGFGNDPFRELAERFVGDDQFDLPDSPDSLRDVMIAEAIRYAIDEKVAGSDEEFPRAHITGIKHWVSHKLGAIFGYPGRADTDDWFMKVLKERAGPTMTFLGDIMELSDGYYSSAPPHAVMTNPSEAVLIAGDPTSAFADKPFDLEMRGISRIIKDTNETELKNNGIPIQARRQYIGLDGERLFTESDLASYIRVQSREDWMPENDWVPYTGSRWGFSGRGNPAEAVLESGFTVSFWHAPVEYGRDLYRLKLEGNSSGPPEMISVPNLYRRHICLLIDAIAGVPQAVELKDTASGVLINCDFVPPRHQTRWLHAIGAEWLETSKNKLQWKIEAEDADSVVRVFEALPISVQNKTGA